ncbi:hypothetical protein M0R45_000206 [Rubus argutus]|uniref:Uncharacterized protein n=1 Tax=Rubus argutus TaxID=59490 RepID=A0AAW1VNK5_RUBAR
MAQWFGWREALSRTAVLVGGYRRVGCLLSSSLLGRSMADFGQRLMPWRSRATSISADSGGSARLKAGSGAYSGLGSSVGFKFGFGPSAVDSVGGGA